MRPAESIDATEQYSRRKLSCENYFTLLFFALHNPVIKSMRSVVQASDFQKVRDELEVDHVSLGSFSEAQHVFDPDLLREVISDLSSKVQIQSKHSDERLKTFIDSLVAVDGTLFDALPRMCWAAYRTQSTNNKVKVHLLYEPLRGGIDNLAITPGNECERKAFKKLIKPGKLYVGDRYYGLDYDYFKCLEEKKADFIFRIRNDALYEVIDSHTVSPLAQAYGVITDQSICFNKDVTDHTWRLVCIQRERKQFLLLTNRMDIDADIIGMLFRNRWEIELFFKWLKCILKCRHFLLESPKGVAAQIYTALILALMLTAATGKKPTKRQMEAIQLHQMGYVCDGELEKILIGN